jgi:hypothetical protein
MDRSPVTTSEKSWWAPVWRGLVVDDEGRHLRRIKGALGLYLYLLMHADRRSGRLVRKYGTIARDMGFPVRTIRAGMARLHFYEYVRITKTGRALVIDIPKWRSIGPDRDTLSGTILPGRVAESGHRPSGTLPGSLRPQGANEVGPLPNESILTKDIKRKRSVRNFSRPDSDPTRTLDEPLIRGELLAQDLAAGLDDSANLPRYRWCAQRFPEPLLRRLLSEARATPEREIKRSRAALFAYLLRQHVLSTAPTEPHDSRD